MQDSRRDPHMILTPTMWKLIKMMLPPLPYILEPVLYYIPKKDRSVDNPQVILPISPLCGGFPKLGVPSWGSP